MSKKLFLHETTVDKWTIQHLTLEIINRFVFFFFTFALHRHFSAFHEISTSDWLDDVFQSKAPYVTIKCKERKRERRFIQIWLKISCLMLFIFCKTFN